MNKEEFIEKWNNAKNTEVLNGCRIITLFKRFDDIEGEYVEDVLYADEYFIHSNDNFVSFFVKCSFIDTLGFYEIKEVE